MRRDNVTPASGNERPEPMALEGTWGFKLATSLLLFGLLTEWLLPWSGSGEWSLFHDPVPLLTVIALLLVVGLLSVPAAIKLIGNASLCVFGLMWMYKGSGQSVAGWLTSLPSLLSDNIGQMLQSGIWAMNGEVRTLLLLVGWAMLVPALQALLWLRHTALGLGALTIAYLVTLHLWLGMEVMGGLLRSTLEGLLLASMAALPRAKSRLGADWLQSGWDQIQRLDKRWAAGAMFLALTIVGFGLMASAGRDGGMEPAAWTREMTGRFNQSIAAWGRDQGDPVAIRSVKASKLGGALTGYGFDDSRLGLPVDDNPELLFTGYSPVNGYWRGEAKTVYDGNGWSHVSGALSLHPIRNANKQVENAAAESGAERETTGQGTWIRQTVVWSNPSAYLPLFASGLNAEVTELIAVNPRRTLGSFLRNEDVDAIYPGTEGVKAERYTVRSYLPPAFGEALRGLDESLANERLEIGERRSQGDAGMPDSSHAAGSAANGSRNAIADHAAVGTAGAATEPAGKEVLSEAELEWYLQLPKSLPDRVSALASEVAGAGVTSQYDRVKAIEAFLEMSYPYTKTDSELPPAGADFVDHFLFEQRKGYCVHFSTAMVVMLRAQGIPARWVKGFAPAEEADGISPGNGAAREGLASGAGGENPAGEGAATNGAGEMKAYQVYASDAHAWVEVYFAGAGWVPFDPTPGMEGVGTAGIAAALPSAAGAVPAAGLAAAGGGGIGAAHLADWIGASAQRAAGLAVRAADSLARTARGAAGAAAAEPAAAAGTAVAAALALCAAVVLAARRETLRLRLRLARGLRRYGAAHARHGAAREAALAASALAAMPRRSRARRDTLAGAVSASRVSWRMNSATAAETELRTAMARAVETVFTLMAAKLRPANQEPQPDGITASPMLLDLQETILQGDGESSGMTKVGRLLHHERPSLAGNLTLRELARSLENGSSDPSFAEELHKLRAWGEEALFSRPAQTYAPPSPVELRLACRALLDKSRGLAISKP